jgi:hypothetical protein
MASSVEEFVGTEEMVVDEGDEVRHALEEVAHQIDQHEEGMYQVSYHSLSTVQE